MNRLILFKNNSCASLCSSIPRISNYFCNYAKYMEQRDAQYEETFKFNNIKSLQDLQEIQDNFKAIAQRDWAFNENVNTSSLHREMKFESREDTIIYINIVKEKCDEMDHHPEWRIEGNNLYINLTSHFNKNNVSEKDYELAAFLSYRYEERGGYKFKYNRRAQTLVSNGFGVLVAVLSTYTLYYLYNLYKNYNITSRDFIFARINKH